MGREIIRPDWGDGQRTVYESENLPAERRDVLREMRSYPNQPEEDGEEELTALSDHQLDTAANVGDHLVAMYGCPDEEALVESLVELSEGTTDLIGRVLLSYPKDPLDAMLKVEAKATIHQTLELKRWYARLPDELKNWICCVD